MKLVFALFILTSFSAIADTITCSKGDPGFGVSVSLTSDSAGKLKITVRDFFGSVGQKPQSFIVTDILLPHYPGEGTTYLNRKNKLEFHVYAAPVPGAPNAAIASLRLGKRDISDLDCQ